MVPPQAVTHFNHLFRQEHALLPQEFLDVNLHLHHTNFLVPHLNLSRLVLAHLHQASNPAAGGLNHYAHLIASSVLLFVKEFLNGYYDDRQFIL